MTTLAETVTETINQFLASGDWPCPYDINCGQCEDFAMEVIDSITGENEALYMIWVEDQQYPRYILYGHAVICMPIEGGYMYFDSECPDGVTNLDDIPVVKNNSQVTVQL